MKRTLWLNVALGLLCLAVAVGSAAAQDWKPNKPLRLIVPWGAGGSTDQAVRSITGALEDALGQKVVVVNQPGGGRGDRDQERAGCPLRRLHLGFGCGEGPGNLHHHRDPQHEGPGLEHLPQFRQCHAGFRNAGRADQGFQGIPGIDEEGPQKGIGGRGGRSLGGSLGHRGDQARPTAGISNS